MLLADLRVACHMLILVTILQSLQHPEMQQPKHLSAAQPSQAGHACLDCFCVDSCMGGCD